MKTLLISANTETINMPVLPIGLGAVAAAVEQEGHEVRVLDLMGAEKPGAAVSKAVEDFAPGVIGISVRNIDDQRMTHPRFLVAQVKEIVSGCRESSRVPVVLGGSGYSIFPQSLLAYLGADMGIQGEGEKAFAQLLSRMEQGVDLSGVPGLYVAGLGEMGKRSFERDLDHFPTPDPRLWLGSPFLHSEIWVPFQTRRGCPMNCTYCSTRSIEGRLIRRRNPERVVEAIARYREAGFSQFHFVDNLFNLSPSYARALCHRLIDRGLDISWRAILYPGVLEHELVRDMREAGCVEVSLGFESGSERMLRGMNKRFGVKEVRRASAMLEDQGVRQMGFLLLGGPGETRESVEESLSFVDSLRVDAVKVTLGIRIYPHTALAETALREGMIGPEEDLLFPRFYLTRGLEEWIPETVERWAAGRTNCIM